MGVRTLAVDVRTLPVDVRTLAVDVRTLPVDVRTLAVDVRTFVLWFGDARDLQGHRTILILNTLSIYLANLYIFAHLLRFLKAYSVSPITSFTSYPFKQYGLLCHLQRVVSILHQGSMCRPEKALITIENTGYVQVGSTEHTIPVLKPGHPGVLVIVCFVFVLF